ncbi:MAG TPA: ice-binding family protein [Candidatus Kryptonia bacterium]
MLKRFSALAITAFVVAPLVVLMAHTSALAQRLPVNLRTAGNFAILAKTGVSTTGTTAVTGDIGVSPAAATYLTGFGQTLDPSGTFSTSSLVTGKLYAADYTAPTPTYVGTAVSDMLTAYTDAAGRTLPDTTELGAGDITGDTLTPGLYKWSTGVTISAGGVTISGSATDVWIFQIAGDLTVANGAIVTLSGGAQAKNIFWQVAGQVTIGTTAQMKGIILCQTQIAMNTGATLDGKALAQTAVTLAGNTVTDPTPPKNVKFQVHMGVQMILGNFHPATDSVLIRGDFQTLAGDTITWGGTRFTMAPSVANDSIYELTVPFADSAAGRWINYKYVIHNATASDVWESINNRTDSIGTAASQAIPLVYFNNQATAGVTHYVTFVADMTNLLKEGFSDVNDSIMVRGDTSPLNWGPGVRLTKTLLNPKQYSVKLQFTAPVGNSIQWKFWAGGTDQYSNTGWENIANNRVYVFADKDTVFPAITPVIDISTPTTGVDTVIFHVDMNGAHEAFHNSLITGLKSVWMCGSVSPLNWPASGWPATDTTVDSLLHRLYDDGTHGDSVAHDNKWSTTLVFPKGASQAVLFKFGAAFNGSDTLGGGLGVDNEAPTGANHSFVLTPPRQSQYNKWGDQVTAIRENPGNRIPSAYGLTQNYPNPFNPTTTINYSVPKNSYVSLKVYNVLGQEVTTLFSGKQQAGNYIATFDASRFASGVYFYRLQAGSYNSVKKMVLMK